MADTPAIDSRPMTDTERRKLARLRTGSNCHVLGIDPSLTRTAAVLIPPNWKLGDWSTLRWTEIEIPNAGYSEKDGDSRWAVEMARVERLGEIVDRLIAWVSENHEGEHLSAWTEGYAFGANSASVTKLAELGGAVRYALYRQLNIVPESVSPQSARKYLLGKLPRKDQKLAAHSAMLAHGVPWRTADVTDGFCVANYGLSELGLVGLSLSSESGG